MDAAKRCKEASQFDCCAATWSEEVDKKKTEITEIIDEDLDEERVMVDAIFFSVFNSSLYVYEWGDGYVYIE